MNLRNKFLCLTTAALMGCSGFVSNITRYDNKRLENDITGFVNVTDTTKVFGKTIIQQSENNEQVIGIAQVRQDVGCGIEVLAGTRGVYTKGDEVVTDLVGTVGVIYGKKFDDLVFQVQAIGEFDETPQGLATLLMTYNHELKENLSLFGRLDQFTLYDTQHSFSQQLIEGGIQYGPFRIGGGARLQYLGEDLDLEDSYHVFVEVFGKKD